jgi:hypothetical protein
VLALKGGVAAPVETPDLDADSFDLEHELAPPSDSVVALFATVREMCGAYSRPAWPSEDPPLPFVERVQLARLEAREMLAELGELEPADVYLVDLEPGAREQSDAELNGRAAASVVEALMLGLRERGSAALVEPDTRRRLSELSEQQIIEVGNRAQRFEACAWSAEDVVQLMMTWKALRS